jgi:aryl-alcohol dehydrogenase-like predicted oxidoreductase
MRFGPNGNPDHDDCTRTIRQPVNACSTFIDTAGAYGNDREKAPTSRRMNRSTMTTSAHIG